MVALDRVDVMEILRNDFIHCRLSCCCICWRAGVGISQWLDGAWFYYWGLSCLIWSAVDTQVVSSPPLHYKACYNKAAYRETHRWWEILLTDRLFLIPPIPSKGAIKMLTPNYWTLCMRISRYTIHWQQIDKHKLGCPNFAGQEAS